QGVNVLVGRIGDGPATKSLPDSIQTAQHRLFFGRRQNPGTPETSGPGFTPLYILGPEALINRQATIELIKRLGRRGGETPTPHLMGRGRVAFSCSGLRTGRRSFFGPTHSAAASTSELARTCASTRIGNPNSLMNPSASDWR